MRNWNKPTGLRSVWGLLLVVFLAACGSETDGKMVNVNLSLIVDGRQAQHRPAVFRFLAWIDRWIPSAPPASAQAVTDIASIQVQITGPGIPTPASTTVQISNPTSGQVIPVSIQAPVGPNRTITVSAFNTGNTKIFGGTLPNVTLTAGAPVDLEITLVRLFTLTVRKQGNGSGTVTSSPPGIDCGATCENQFPDGTTVSLTASAAPGSFFASWGGACSGNTVCNVNGNATVTAEFTAAPNTATLTVTKSGTGSGTVTSTPSGISCGVACSAEFTTPTTVVSLEATPAAGSTFAGWSGAGCSGTGPCTVMIVGNQNVTATFTASAPVPMSTLTVEKNGSGTGTVTSAPSGINCGGGCTASFPTGNAVSLMPNAEPGSTFVTWSGACSGAGGCTVTMNSDQTVSAQFDLVLIPPDLVTLTVGKQGNGDGTVTSDPAGIFCGGACQFSYQRGTIVTLTATPDGDSSFNDWHQGPCDNSSSATCQLQMNDNQTVSAHFDREGPGGGRGGG